MKSLQIAIALFVALLSSPVMAMPEAKPSITQPQPVAGCGQEEGDFTGILTPQITGALNEVARKENRKQNCFQIKTIAFLSETDKIIGGQK